MGERSTYIYRLKINCRFSRFLDDILKTELCANRYGLDRDFMFGLRSTCCFFS